MHTLVQLWLDFISPFSLSGLGGLVSFSLQNWILLAYGIYITVLLWFSPDGWMDTAGNRPRRPLSG